MRDFNIFGCKVVINPDQQAAGDLKVATTFPSRRLDAITQPVAVMGCGAQSAASNIL